MVDVTHIAKLIHVAEDCVRAVRVAFPDASEHTIKLVCENALMTALEKDTALTVRQTNGM